MRKYAVLILLPVLILTLFALAPDVEADATLSPPANTWGVNGSGLAAIFATYARTERDTYDYAAPGGDAVKFLQGNQSFWLSVRDRVAGPDGQTWFRTATNRWVRASDVRIFQSARFRGAYWNGLYDDGEKPDQFGFILDYGTHVHDTPDIDANDTRYLDKYMWVPLYGQQNGWWDIGDGEWVSNNLVRPVRYAARPQGVGAADKWIDVDLTRQTVSAYEGDRMVFSTLTSTGKRTTPTITGLFSVYNKVVTHTMQGMSETGPYYLEEVPWSMYFTQAYAIHGAYWHDGFGAIRSAGCVNLSPVDAKWLFSWAGPVLPAGFNSINASAQNPGTWVYVHY